MLTFDHGQSNPPGYQHTAELPKLEQCDIAAKTPKLRNEAVGAGKTRVAVSLAGQLAKRMFQSGATY